MKRYKAVECFLLFHGQAVAGVGDDDAGLAPGDYRLITGFYDAETGAGLALTSGESQVTLWEGEGSGLD